MFRDTWGFEMDNTIEQRIARLERMMYLLIGLQGAGALSQFGLL